MLGVLDRLRPRLPVVGAVLYPPHMARRRSGRSYVVELLFILAVFAGAYLFLTLGGPAIFGEWFAGQLSGG